MFGYVYVIEPAEHHIKIGISKQPVIRLNKLKLSSGMEPKRKWVSERISTFMEVEKLLHHLFSEHRGIGEYFAMSYEEAMEAAKDLCEAKDFLELRRAYRTLLGVMIHGED